MSTCEFLLTYVCNSTWVNPVQRPGSPKIFKQKYLYLTLLIASSSCPYIPWLGSNTCGFVWRHDVDSFTWILLSSYEYCCSCQSMSGTEVWGTEVWGTEVLTYSTVYETLPTIRIGWRRQPAVNMLTVYKPTHTNTHFQQRTKKIKDTTKPLMANLDITL